MIAAVLALMLAAPAAVPSPFSVQVRGSGPDVLLIPGLACSGDVWDQVVSHLEKDHRVHTFTLAGFAGEPRIAAPMLAAEREAIAQYIVEHKLSQPTVVGHSLGGVLALWLGAAHPELVGGIIAVDGVPFLPALTDPTANADSARPQAEAMVARMREETPAQFAANNRMYATNMVNAPTDVDRIAGWGARSDPSAVIDAMYELLTTDLRPAMARVRAPILELAAAGFARDEASRKEVYERYEAQLKEAPHHRVVLATQSRHFIMMDDLPFLLGQLDAFLAEPK